MPAIPMVISHYLWYMSLYSQDSISVVEPFAHRVPQKLHAPAEAAH